MCIRDSHYASLDILSKIGIVMKDPRGRQLLLDAGAIESDGRIKIPPNLIYDALASAPERIPMYNRLGEPTMPLELGRVFFGPGSDTPFTIDVETGQRRKATAADVETIARLCDALDSLDFIMSMGVPSDVPPDDVFIHGFIGMMRGSVKPVVYTANNRRDMEDIYRIAVAIAGDKDTLREKPFLLLYAEPISPLLFAPEAVEKLLFCAEKGLPSSFPPSPNTGGGGPITVAGALALGNAECLAGLTLTQLARKGVPFLYGMNVAALDMKTAVISYGAPEWSLAMAAEVALAEFYNLPVWGFGGATDSKVIDAQAGLEAAFSIYTAFLSRCTLVHDVGYIESGLTSSMEMLVMADEIIRMTRFLLAGVEVSDETLALDAIARADPGGGFLADDHTLKHWRTAQWFPSVLDRRQYNDWVSLGSKDLYTRLNERVRAILSEHQVSPLPAEAEEVIADVLAERARRRMEYTA